MKGPIASLYIFDVDQELSGNHRTGERGCEATIGQENKEAVHSVSDILLIG